MYTFESRIRFSEVDHHETITLPGIINYFQDCSTFHSEDMGLGIDALKKKQKVWILSFWQVIVNRYPGMGEKVAVSTWSTGFQGLYGTRNFQMKDANQEVLAYANSIWVYMDMEKGRPAKPDPEEIAVYGVEPALDMEYASRKIRLPETVVEGPAFPVRKFQIDTNEHVNNCQYVEMALEALEEEIQVREIRVEYKKSARYQDIIVPKIAREENRTVVELCDTQDKPYAVVELMGE
ncbi:acyl-[acyl-carrier-protein] thioesterase [Sporofaciens sp. SGI.106]|uniref:acyl-[acyl-carrier-protein] thioesterase n=1 Tax=Sporofaciens sp. SGI.106 TaxID=3420568 RepID=UPI003D0263D4